MTRNHGTVMSLSYDAPCPEGEKVRESGGGEPEKGKEENERIHRCIRQDEKERERERREYILETKEKERRRSLSYVTPTGLSSHSLYPSLGFFSHISLTFAELVGLKSRFSGRDDRYASRCFLLYTY